MKYFCICGLDFQTLEEFQTHLVHISDKDLDQLNDFMYNICKILYEEKTRRLGMLTL